MIMGINGSAIGEEEKGTRFSGNSGLDPGNGFSNGSKFESSNTRGSQERSENHVIARGHANDVVDLRVQALHEAAPGPAGAQHHDAGLLVGLGGPQARMAKRAWAGYGGQASD